MYTNKKIIIFGTGKAAESTYSELIFNGEDVEYFLDNDKAKQGQLFKDKPIYDPMKILEEDKEKIHIIVASMYYKEISEQLDNFGLFKNIDYSVKKMVSQFNNYGKFSGFIKGVPENLTTLKSADDVGNVVIDKQNEKIYRVIRDDKIEETKRIVDLCNNNNLFGTYIVQTDINNNVIDRKLVLEHEYIRALTYPYEWTKAMFKDSCLFHLNFLRKLNELGLTLKDGHNYNITFHKGKFIWVDFGSIVKGTLEESVVYQIILCYINTYIMFNKKDGMEKVFYAIQSCIYFEFKDIVGYLSDKEIKEYENYIKQINICLKHKDNLKLLEILEQWLLNIRFYEEDGYWTNYQDRIEAYVDSPELWDNKEKTVIEMIEKINPSSILDIAGNSGFFCFVMSKRNKECVLCDIDMGCIEKAYKKILSDDIKNVIPVKMDFIKNYSFANAPSILQEDRFKSDLVMAIALIHHLVFAQKMFFEEIINSLYRYSNKYLLVEFTSEYEENVSGWMNEDFDWYNYDNFLKHLNKKFKVLFTRNYAEHRTLLMCEKL